MATVATGGSSPDAARMKIHFLDVGKTKYGDSILVEIGSRRILVDGAHPGDYVDRDGSPGIPSQLAELFGHGPPFRVSLLVVTHCHGDHIGCLPRLVRDGILEADWALVADERLGFGRPAHDADDPLAAADVTPEMRAAIAALAEESLADITSDAELAELIADAARLEDNYKEMLRKLRTGGTKLFRYGRDDHKPLADEFATLGLKILGPTSDHLLICAEVIRELASDAVALLSEQRADEEAPHDAVSLYRLLAQAAADAPDMPGIGAAKNDQSIVLSVAAGGWSALLTGDMQFAKAEVSELDDIMSQLRDDVADAGPFDLVKTSHHSSYNGVDEDTIEAFGAKTLVHSGGWNDPGHPSSSVLRLLRRKRDEWTWARTDKNGQITASRVAGAIELDVARGHLNNAAANRRHDEAEPAAPATRPVVALPAAPAVVPPTPPAVAAKVVPAVSDVVEVIAKVPHTATRVALTIDVMPGAAATRGREKAEPHDPGEEPLRVGDGRQLPRLLFVTNRDRLAANLGQAEAARALDAIRASGHQLLDGVADEVRTAAQAVVQELRATSIAGVVLLGGYDVVPAQRFDVLPPALRARLRNPNAELDQFVVWSDDVYGCVDGDDLPDVPVSRIPDGKSPQLVFRALSASGHMRRTRFSIRNYARPFAAGVFAGLDGQGVLEVCETFSSETLAHQPQVLSSDSVYLMLHGADSDATRFWGETQGEEMLEAIHVGNLPLECRATVFTGCCWGAMPVMQRASRATGAAQAGPRTPANSLALAFLLAGAQAFVGCTGAHYSPTIPPYDFYGGPLHEAFWRQLAQTAGPAQALFEAKREYLRGIPHRQVGSPAAVAQNEAIELKLMRQYTCLGLGW